MNFDLRYEVSAPDIVAEDFGSEIVVLNLLNGRYFSLPEALAAIWRDLASGHQPSRLIKLASTAGLSEAMTAFISKLIEEGLIRTSPGTDAPPLPPATGAAVSLLAGNSLPVLEAFDDMADLLLADPIHDVEEEMGWPVRRDPAKP